VTSLYGRCWSGQRPSRTSAFYRVTGNPGAAEVASSMPSDIVCRIDCGLGHLYGGRSRRATAHGSRSRASPNFCRNMRNIRGNPMSARHTQRCGYAATRAVPAAPRAHRRNPCQSSTLRRCGFFSGAAASFCWALPSRRLRTVPAPRAALTFCRNIRNVSGNPIPSRHAALRLCRNASCSRGCVCAAHGCLPAIELAGMLNFSRAASVRCSRNKTLRATLMVRD